jgi:hypothetical protein
LVQREGAGLFCLPKLERRTNFLQSVLLKNLTEHKGLGLMSLQGGTDDGKNEDKVEYGIYLLVFTGFEHSSVIMINHNEGFRRWTLSYANSKIQGGYKLSEYFAKPHFHKH